MPKNGPYRAFLLSRIEAPEIRILGLKEYQKSIMRTTTFLEPD